jgi:hypothetical protein
VELEFAHDVVQREHVGHLAVHLGQLRGTEGKGREEAMKSSYEVKQGRARSATDGTVDESEQCTRKKRWQQRTRVERNQDKQAVQEERETGWNRSAHLDDAIANGGRPVELAVVRRLNLCDH